jgi:hypothetical protein
MDPTRVAYITAIIVETDIDIITEASRYAAEPENEYQLCQGGI